ncbi:22096_t:CDS:2, partial [Gigaspora margarita]
CNKSFKKLWILTRHLNNKFPCKPKVLDLLSTFRTHAPKIVHTSKIPDPILQIEPDIVNPLDQVSEMKCPALQTSQTDEYLSREEFEVSDPQRPYDNFNSMSNWEAIVPSTKNLAYRFIKPISDSKIYAEMPYMP